MSLTESAPLAGAALANVGNSPWTDDRIAELTRMWEFEKMSASQIAAALGCFKHCCDGGRSAVIGKAHRLNLEARVRMVRKPEPRRVYKSKPRHARTFYIPQFLRPHAAEPKERPAVAAVAEPVPAVFATAPCSLLELTDDICHWPNGDPGEPGFHFCGGYAITGTSYCGFHCRVAYQPPAARRDRRPARA